MGRFHDYAERRRVGDDLARAAWNHAVLRAAAGSSGDLFVHPDSALRLPVGGQFG